MLLQINDPPLQTAFPFFDEVFRLLPVGFTFLWNVIPFFGLYHIPVILPGAPFLFCPSWLRTSAGALAFSSFNANPKDVTFLPPFTLPKDLGRTSFEARIIPRQCILC